MNAPAAQPAEASDQACFSLGVLLDDLRRHPELDLDTLTYHVQQSDATAGDGYWHASINEARSFLEALVMSIAAAPHSEALARRNGELDAYHKGRESHSAFRLGCKFLGAAGFLDSEEEQLLQRVYGMASAKGSHRGVTNEAWSRLVRRMVFASGQYVIQHYEAWKSAGPGASQRGPDAQAPAFRKSGWRRCLSALIRRQPQSQAAALQRGHDRQPGMGVDHPRRR